MTLIDTRPLTRVPTMVTEIVHGLYRFFSVDSVLLYVGISVDPGRRLTQHAAVKDWWREIATITISQYPDRTSVLVAEKIAIEEEKPVYNVIHNNVRMNNKTSNSVIVKKDIKNKCSTRQSNGISIIMHDTVFIKLRALLSLDDPDMGRDGYVTCTMLQLLSGEKMRVRRDDTGKTLVICLDNRIRWLTRDMLDKVS